MAINYCDWANGNDTTGDGTFGNPYKTITQASTGLTGGDEIRCAKNPDDTNLSGNLTFVDGSTSITTSENLTSELIQGDFIYKTGESDNIHEVTSLNSTTLNLYKAYHGNTETTAGKKLGIISTGPCAHLTEIIQSIESSGNSPSFRLKVSGGWDLSTQTQTGETNFQHLHSGFLSHLRYGYGLYIDNKKYIKIENLGFLRYYRGIYLNSSNNNTINDVICNNNGDCGILISTSMDDIITSSICNNNTQYGLRSYRNERTIINKYSGTGNEIEDISIFNDLKILEEPLLKMQHYKTVGDNRCYYRFGITYRDTAEAQSTQCLRYEPTSDTYYIMQKFRFAVLSGLEKVISFYIKDDVAFDGDTQAALYFMEEKISGWLTIPTTNDYVRHTLIAQAVDITEDGVLQLRIKVRGTAGNVYVDDLGAS